MSALSAVRRDVACMFAPIQGFSNSAQARTRSVELLERPTLARIDLDWKRPRMRCKTSAAASIEPGRTALRIGAVQSDRGCAARMTGCVQPAQTADGFAIIARPPSHLLDAGKDTPHAQADLGHHANA